MIIKKEILIIRVILDIKIVDIQNILEDILVEKGKEDLIILQEILNIIEDPLNPAITDQKMRKDIEKKMIKNTEEGILNLIVMIIQILIRKKKRKKL